MPDQNLSADPMRAVLLLELEALALQAVALDEAAGLLPNRVHRDLVRRALEPVDGMLAELRQRIDPGGGAQ